MLDQTELEPMVANIFRETLHLVPPAHDTDLFKTGALDSLLLVDLLVKLEHTFKIRIPLEELELDHFRSITSIAGFLSVCLQQKRLVGNVCG